MHALLQHLLPSPELIVKEVWTQIPYFLRCLHSTPAPPLLLPLGNPRRSHWYDAILSCIFRFFIHIQNRSRFIKKRDVVPRTNAKGIEIGLAFATSILTYDSLFDCIIVLSIYNILYHLHEENI
jgi:hypothetical protein